MSEGEAPSEAAASGARPKAKKKRGPFSDGPFLVFLGIALVSGALCWSRGAGVFSQALGASRAMLLEVAPRFLLAFFLAGFVQVLVPGALIQRWVGEQSGVKGIVIAALAGMVTPGGPMVSFPLITALYRLGADYGPLVSYITSWEILGMQRILIWELPLLGPKFTLLRFAVSCLLPVIAGLTARRLAPHFKTVPRAEGG